MDPIALRSQLRARARPETVHTSTEDDQKPSYADASYWNDRYAKKDDAFEWLCVLIMPMRMTMAKTLCEYVQRLNNYGLQSGYYHTGNFGLSQIPNSRLNGSLIGP